MDGRRSRWHNEAVEQAQSACLDGGSRLENWVEGGYEISCSDWSITAAGK